MDPSQTRTPQVPEQLTPPILSPLRPIPKRTVVTPAPVMPSATLESANVPGPGLSRKEATEISNVQK